MVIHYELRQFKINISIAKAIGPGYIGIVGMDLYSIITFAGHAVNGRTGIIDTIMGFAGIDTITGFAGIDTITGFAGIDSTHSIDTILRRAATTAALAQIQTPVTPSNTTSIWSSVGARILKLKVILETPLNAVCSTLLTLTSSPLF